MLINENLIVLELDTISKTDAIFKLAGFGFKEGRISSLDEFVNNVLQREDSYTTGVGNGIAIPHAKSKAVKEAMVVFGKTRNGIRWDSLDDQPVNLIFLLGVPEEGTDNLHLKILSQLSRKLMNEDFVQLIKNAETKQEVLTALKDIVVN